MSGWKLIALFYIQIMSSDIQNQLLQLILKSWHKPINKMNLQRDKNYSYWKGKKKNNNQQPSNHSAETYVMLGPFQKWNFLWVPNTYSSRRKSVDSREFLNFFIFCPNNLCSTLISKITLKLETAFIFFQESGKVWRTLNRRSFEYENSENWAFSSRSYTKTG